MNYTDEQIKLAGFLQPDDGPREFNSALDLQGEGIRVLESGVQIDEENTGDCCAELEISESTNNALTQENNALSAENGELQDEVIANSIVGGAGGTASGIVETTSGVFGEVSVSLTCTRIEPFSSGKPNSFTRYWWSCVWSTTPDPNIPGPISGSSAIRVVWIKSTGEERYGISLIDANLGGFSGVSPWAINNPTVKPNSGSCQFYTDISPFSSDATATVFNTVRFDVRAQTTYSPKSAWTPVLYRATGGGSQTNGTTIDPNA